MLRILITYLFLLNACSYSIMNVRELCLNNFVNAEMTEVGQKQTMHASNLLSIDNCSTHGFPSTDTSMFDNLFLENEIETETDLLNTIELPLYILENFQYSFYKAYTVYSASIVKVEFLDIFSPPPNC